MFDEFKKAQDEKEKEQPNEIIPDNADENKKAEDGKPTTPEIEGVLEMREEISDSKPSNTSIVKRDKDLPPTDEKTINSALREVPKLCDQCYLIDKCPHYEEGATCYFRNQINIHGRDSLVEIMKMLLEVQGERVMFGRLIEQSEGGYIDQNLSKEMKMLMDLMKDFKDVMSPPKEEVTIKASGKEQSQGIISQLFGGAQQGGNDNNEDNS